MLMILAIFLIAIFALKFSSFQFQNKYIDLIKPLFPSWSFFCNPEDIYLLQYQIITSGNEGEWKNVFKKRSRKLTTLFHNPEINFLHAMDTQVHHLVAEIYNNSESDDFDCERYANYSAINRVVYQEISKNETRIDGPDQYRFRIRQGHFVGEVFSWEDFFYSNIYPLCRTKS